MNSGIFLADAGNIGLLACAAIDTAAVISYAARARGGAHGAWWRTPTGIHLMCFIAAFAVVLDLSAVYLLVTGQVLMHAAPPFRPDWYAWLRVAAFNTLIPPVLAWRLWLILRPPRGRLPSPFPLPRKGMSPVSITMFDSVDLSQIPADAQAVACYVDGRFASSAQARDRFPHARILTIAVFAEHDADCLDIETGDATPAQAAAWYTRQRARGLTRPCLYASASVMEAAVLPVLKAAGIPVSSASLRLWSAHYTHKPHICGPTTCGAVSAAMDGTQWTDRALGRNLDQSLLADGFFAATQEGWTARMIANLPVLAEGAQDKPGHVFFIRRLQALLRVYGEINGIAAAACIPVAGTFDGPTAAAVKAVQAHKKLTQDGIVGPQTWGVLIAGTPA